MEQECSLPSPVDTILNHSNTINIHTTSFNIYFIIILPSTFTSSKTCLHLGFPTKILHMFLKFLMRATYPTQLNPFNTI
jgi:hypothetical protein